jgi:hypothetical protein
MSPDYHRDSITDYPNENYKDNHNEDYQNVGHQNPHPGNFIIKSLFHQI